MFRRGYAKTIGMAATASLAGLAGCSSSGGGEVSGEASGEVVENIFDEIEVLSHRIENTTAMGTDAVETIATVENVGQDAVTLGLAVTLYDGSDTVLDSPDFSIDNTVEGGVSQEISQSYEGRKADVARYEIRIVEPST